MQAALACASSGDVIQLAASSTPYPGVGAVAHSVTIQAAPGASARSVKIDVSQPLDSSGHSTGLMSVPWGVSAKVQGVTIACLQTGLQCLGSLVTDNGSLSLSRVTLTGGLYAAPISEVSTDAGPAQLTVTASAIVHNRNDGVAGAGGNAGAIEVLGSSGGVKQSQLTVANSTLADNLAQDAGGQSIGAIYTNEVQNGVIMLLGDTITGNEGAKAGGLYDPITDGSSSPIELANTIVAANTTSYPGNPNVAPDCLGSFADTPAGHNLIGDASNCHGLTNSVNGDQVSVSDPSLNQLANNGGPTDTVGLQPQSSAIGAGDQSTCATAPIAGRDQRGYSRRTIQRGCDIGAYDTQGYAPAAPRTWFVSGSGSGSVCSSNSQSAPFGTVQAALACASGGDVIQLAASSTPYPGVGAVAHSVTIEAAPGASARSVKIDVSQPLDSSGHSTGLMSVPWGVVGEGGGRDDRVPADRAAVLGFAGNRQWQLVAVQGDADRRAACRPDQRGLDRCGAGAADGDRFGDRAQP